MIDGLCQDIVRQLHINRIVETGTDKGETVAETSRWFAELDPDFGTVVDTVTTRARSYGCGSEPIAYPIFAGVKASPYQIHSVDVDEHSYKAARDTFRSNGNIVVHHGSSEEFLARLLASEMEHKRIHRYLFFLDAHWGKHWPLRDELKVIRKLDKYAVVIDDFLVPGKSNPSFPHGSFGFDIYRGQILNWAYIYDLFVADSVRVFYPNRPNRDRRGWVLILHGHSDEELQFLRSLELFEIPQFDQRHTTPVKAPWLSYLDGRNVLKTLVPVPLLRSMYRLYEKMLR